MEEDLNEWFIREILPHERALMRFLSRVWPDRSEIEDIRHEAYIRIYESAAKVRPTAPRAFLFVTARHLMMDRIRRGRIVSIQLEEDLDLLNVLIDEISPERRLGARQELWRLVQALYALPPKCRDVMWMVKVEELTQKEIAERLQLTVKMVEKRVALGVSLLQKKYFGSQKLHERRAYHSDAKDEPGHG